MKFTRLALMGLLLLLLLPLSCARQDPKLQAKERLTRVGYLLTTYSMNNDVHFPDMSTPEATHSALKATLDKQDENDPAWKWKGQGDNVFVHPSSGKLWVPNPRLSKLSLAVDNDPTQTIYFHAPVPDGDKRLVGYGDGHLKWIRESEWPAAKVAGDAGITTVR